MRHRGEDPNADYERMAEDRLEARYGADVDRKLWGGVDIVDADR